MKPKGGGDPSAPSRRRSRLTSAISKASRSSSTRRRPSSSAPAGAGWSSRPASSPSSPRPTRTTRSRPASTRCWATTSGSTPTTESTRTSDRTILPRGGASELGRVNKRFATAQSYKVIFSGATSRPHLASGMQGFSLFRGGGGRVMAKGGLRHLAAWRRFLRPRNRLPSPVRVPLPRHTLSRGTPGRSPIPTLRAARPASWSHRALGG